jgi:DNA-binding transcriptional MerR regulator
MVKRAELSGAHGHYRISELVEKSGATREMIKYYLRDNLLPPAIKPRPNLALYSDQHVQLIAVIQRFQKQTRLSLTQIAEIIAGQDYDPRRLEIQLLSGKFSRQHGGTINPLKDGQSPSQRGLNFSDQFVAELRECGLLRDDEVMSADDENIASLLWNAREIGLSLSLFSEAHKSLVSLAELQINSLIKTLPVTGDFSRTIVNHEEADQLFNRWLITDKTQILRHKYQQILDDTERDMAHSVEAIYIPSAVFYKRFGVGSDIANWQSSIRESGTGSHRAQEYAAAAVMLTDYEHAVELCDASLAAGNDPQHFWAVKCVAFMMQKRMADAGECLKHLKSTDENSIWFFTARLLYLLLQGAELGAISDASKTMSEALLLYQRAMSECSAGNAMEELDVKLLRGRACVMFSQWLPPDQQAVESLREIVEIVGSASAAELSLPSEAVRVMYQIYGHYYLAKLLDATDESPQARQHYEKVMLLDPASNFGEYAYLRLAE